MAADLDLLFRKLRETFDGRMSTLQQSFGELTMELPASQLRSVLQRLRDDADFAFEQLIDLCGIDYMTYGSDLGEPGLYLPDPERTPVHPHRFAVIYHLLSVSRNARLRVRVYAEEGDFPTLESVVDIWPSANWYEREAFDMYGIVFLGHPDLRRILSDYGFVGNPFRKDFPLSGQVEMRYDPEARRVVYQPVSIEPRQITPRVVREETFARPPL